MELLKGGRDVAGGGTFADDASSWRLGVPELRNLSLHTRLARVKPWRASVSSLLEGRFQVRDPLRSTFSRTIQQLIFVDRPRS